MIYDRIENIKISNSAFAQSIKMKSEVTGTIKLSLQQVMSILIYFWE